MNPRSILFPVAALAATVAVALPIATGGAQSAPRQFTVTQGTETAHFDDVAPLTMKRGKLSTGDRIMSTADVRIDGKAAGTFHSVGTVTNRTPRTFARFTAMLDVTLHLRDGNLFGVGFVDAADRSDLRTVVIGGTGAYEGATGSAVSSGKSTVITLNP